MIDGIFEYKSTSHAYRVATVLQALQIRMTIKSWHKAMAVATSTTTNPDHMLTLGTLGSGEVWRICYTAPDDSTNMQQLLKYLYRVIKEEGATATMTLSKELSHASSD